MLWPPPAPEVGAAEAVTPVPFFLSLRRKWFNNILQNTSEDYTSCLRSTRHGCFS